MLPQLANSPFAMFALFSVGFAAIRVEDIPNGIMPAKRQLAGTGSSSVGSSSAPVTPSDSVTSSSAPPTTSSSLPPSTTSSSSSIPITSSSSVESTSSSHSSVSSSSKIISSSSDIVVIDSSTINRSTLKSATTVTHPFTTSATIHSSFTSTFTNGGSTFASVVQTDQVVASTGESTATIIPALAGNGGSGGNNISANTKKIIGGVVGGIGGAALIAGIALVAWRLWGKKKRQAADNNDYTDPHDPIAHEKRASNGRPFLSEQYHNPNGAVNQASNF